MNARLILPLAAVLGVACVDTNPDTWCQSHPEICDTRLHAVTPSMGPTTGGTVVTLTGQALEEGGEIFFGDKTLVTVSYDPSRTQATGHTQTNAAGPVTIRIVNRNGETTASGLYTFVLPTTLSSVSPARGARAGGTRVQVTGTNIHPGSKLFLGTLEATELQINSQGTLISGTLPPAASLGFTDVRVTGPGGTARLENAFQYVAWERLSTAGVADTGGFVQLERSGSSSTFYARTPSDLFRSPNNGDTWTRVPRPPGGSGSQQSLAVDPFTPERLYFTGNQVFWSGDSGATWTRSQLSGATDGLYAFALVVRPSDGAVFAIDYDGLYRSVDGGVTFTRLSTLPFTSAQGLCLHPYAPDMVMVLGYDGWRGVSTNGGQTFSTSQEPGNNYSFCKAGMTANEVWLSDNTPQLRVSNDGAVTFAAPAPPLTGSYVSDLVADPSGAGRYVVSDGWNIYELNRADAVPAWNVVGNGIGGQLELDTSGQVLAAGSNGILRGSGMVGGTWTPRNVGLENPYVTSVAVDHSGSSSRLFMGTYSGKIFQTTDQGLTWQQRGDLASNVSALTVILEDGAPVLYALAGSGAWRAPLSTGVWTEAKDDTGAPLWAYHLVSDPAAPGELFLQRGSDFFRRQSTGTFVLDNVGLPDPSTHSFSPAATRPTGGGGVTLYTVARPSGLPMQVYGHVQGGSWAPVGTALPDSIDGSLNAFGVTQEGLLAYLNQKMYLMPFADGQWVEITGEQLPWYPERFLADPTDRSKVLAINGYSVFRSDNSGRLWRPTELLTYDGYVSAAAMDPSAPQSIYLAAGPAGVVVSHTGGE